MLAPQRSKTRFEDLVVWQLGCDLVATVFEITGGGALAREFALRDQLRRAAISVPSNIAEGFERGSRREFVRFLYIAKGSAGEVRTQVHLAQRLGYSNGQDHQSCVELCERVSKALAGLIRHHEVAGNSRRWNEQLT